MEYLTLHDIPQRHCNPVHSHRMASQSGERPVAHMAAVCDIISFTSSSDLEPHTETVLLLPAHFPRCVVCSGSRKEAPQHLPLKFITLPELSPASSSIPSDSCSFCRHSFPFDDSMGLNNVPGHLPRPQDKGCTEAEHKGFLDWFLTKTATQEHLQRSSPPLQPGEQAFPGKLPSFNEVSTV
jgi:hypothetical protein